MRKIILLVSFLVASCQPVTTPPSVTATGTNHPPVPTETPLPRTPTDTPVPPPTVPVSIVELEGAEVPPGFSLIRFADLPRPTAFAFDEQGQMYVTSQDGSVYRLTDENEDGRAEPRTLFASGLTVPLGIAVHMPSGEIYVSHQGVISSLQDADHDGRADGEKILVGNLPFGNHQNDNLEFGPDGLLYVGVGSTCDACQDIHPWAATILRFDIEAGEGEIFATGLRNPFDIAFHPQTGELFATDNGRDDLGMDAPYEELNHIVQGGEYGYPGCWNEHDQPGCEDTIPPAAFFESHSSANGVDIYAGQGFPVEYQGNVFVTIFGSWLKPNVQTGIQRVVLTPRGESYEGEASWFIRFPEGVMPLPLAFGPDNALYVGDYINDAIYRISYGAP